MATLPERPSYRRLPDGETELSVRFGEAGTFASVIGTRTRALEKPSARSTGALLVRFRLGGAHPFFGQPLSALTDQVVPLEDVWSREAQLQFARSDDVAGVAASLTRMLACGDVYDPASARTVRRAVQLIAAGDELPRVPRLAAELGVSERQLRRGFDEVIGLSPKHYLRVVRFRRALRAARGSGVADWARIAEQVGYYDQAHLIADFREMSGMTPGVWVGRS
jgi:AraC-like DNA-binding protein